MTERITIRETVRIKPEESSDPKYREFHSRLLPGITDVMGVCTPVLRDIAKDLKESGWQEYIKEVSDAWKEKGRGTDDVLCDEMIIQGLCICGGCRDWDTTGEYITAFVPAVNDWVVCDIFCGSLKVTGRYKEEVWQFIQPYFRSGGEYGLCSETVILLPHYTDRACLGHAPRLLGGAYHTGYYIKMAATWTFSVYSVKFPDQIMEYLKQSSLDDWTYNKVPQKITESFRVDRETKKLVWQMRRGR